MCGSTSGVQSLCAVIANGTDLPHQEELVQALRRAEPDLAGVVLSVNQEKTNVILGKTHRCLWGRDYLEDTLCGLTFRLSVPSFYQVNREQAEVLYGRALAFAGLTGRETGVGPLLRHWNHYPGHGPAGGAGHWGGGDPRRGGGRQGQRGPQRGDQRGVSLRRRGAGRPRPWPTAACAPM